ncbi:MAG: dihydroneopterin aldolase [Bacteroidota bacterium]
MKDSITPIWGTIAVEGIEVFGYHGVYAIEQREGQHFTVDVYLTVNLANAGSTDELTDTVDYAKVYQLILEVMSHPVHLLEKLVVEVRDQLLTQFAGVKAGRIRVAKLRPLSMEQCKRTYVELPFERA